MNNRTREAEKVFHSLEQLKGELFPNMPFEPEDNIPSKGEVDEADSLAEKLIHDLMTKPKSKEV